MPLDTSELVKALAEMAGMLKRQIKRNRELEAMIRDMQRREKDSVAKGYCDICAKVSQ